MNRDVLAISKRYKTDINPIFILQESFSDLYKQNAISELQEWYAYDVEVLNSILIQEGLGDMIKSAGQKIGGAVKGVGNFAMKKLATALGKLLKMAMPSEEEAQKLQQEVEKLKDPNFLAQQATVGNKLLGGGEASEASEEEVYESTRRFLLNTVFSESNLIDLFNTQLLIEAKVGKPKNSKEKKAEKPKKTPTGKINVPAGGFQKANMASLDPAIMELVSAIQQMKSGRQKQALNRIARTIAKKTKLNFPVPYPKINKQDEQDSSETQTSNQNNQLTKTGNENLLNATGGQSSQLSMIGTKNQKFGTRNQPPVVDAEYTDIPDDNSSQSNNGNTKSLFRKIIGYIKDHPKISSTVALGLIAAVTVASGRFLLPLIIAGLTTGGIRAGIAAYQSKKQNGKVNWGKTVDALFTGTAQGAGFAAVGQAAKGLIGGFDSADASGTHDGGLDPNNDVEAQADMKANDAQYPQQTQVSDDLFKQYNKSPYNPTSPLDQAKKAIMQKLSDANNGQIPETQYNDLASKAKRLINQGKKSGAVVSQLFPESYTVNYLRYF